MKKLPIGIQSFSKIRKEDFCYVDKTSFLYKLISENSYYFLSRPRRFGKSLLLDTAKHLFLGHKDLFNGLDIEKKWDFNTHYPVLLISFGSGVVENRKKLELKFHDLLLEYETIYGIKLKSKTIDGRFSELIKKIATKYSKTVVILIDEYDKPILDNISNLEVSKNIRTGLKNFYSVIKDNDEFIKFVLITGVSKFSQVSLFSGLNNLEDISLNPNFGAICGYSQKDIKKVFCQYTKGVDFDKLKTWYNGFNFLGDVVQYNPFDILLYLKNKRFKNYWFETATPTFLISLLENKNFFMPKLESLEVSENVLGSFDIERIELITLLFQTGYLTIDEQIQMGNKTVYKLKIPNLEVKMSLFDYILDYLTQDVTQKQRNQLDMYRLLLNCELDKLKSIFHSFFASIPHNWYRKNQIAEYEGYYASIFYSYFVGMGLEVIPEDITNHGNIDITVKLENLVFIIEFKVIEMDKSAKDPLCQIKEKKYYEKYVDKEISIYLIGVEFSKTDRNIKFYKWEKL